MNITPVLFQTGTYAGAKVAECSFAGIITSETVFEAGFTSDWHAHENPHFSHILSGGSKELGRYKAQVQREGAGLYYYPGIAHQNMYYRPGTRIFNVELEDAFFRKHGLEIPAQELMENAKRPVNSAGLIRILKEHYYHDQDSAIAIEQLCVILTANRFAQVKRYPEWTLRLTTVLNDQWNQPVSLSELAADVDIHPVTLSKYFQRYFGCNLGEYLRRIKLERALALIRNGKQNLTSIACECGFTDQAHFIRVFRQLTGMRPRQYKNI